MRKRTKVVAIIMVAMELPTTAFFSPMMPGKLNPLCAMKREDNPEKRERGLSFPLGSSSRGARKKEPPKKESGANKEGFFRGIGKRVQGMNLRNGKVDSRNVNKRRRRKNLEDEFDLGILEEPPNIVEGVMQTVDEVFQKVDEMRKQVDSVRSAEVLEEAVRSGILLSAEEEQRRIAELREQLENNRKKQMQLEKARKELATAEAKNKEESRKQAIANAKQKVEERLKSAKDQKEQYKRQQKLLRVATGKAPVESLGKGRASVLPPLKKSNETKTETPASGKTGGTFSALGGAQRFMSNMWDSTFAKREKWVVAFPKSRIDPGEVVPVKVAGLDLLVVASRDGRKIYCIANSCSHLGTPLETGMVERRKTERSVDAHDSQEDCIVCPLHHTAFSLETGDVNGPWCPYPPVIGKVMGNVKPKSSVAVFDIRTRGKNIEVKINSQLDDLFDSVKGKK